MTKLSTAVLAAGIILGLSPPIVRAADWTSKDWSNFQASAQKCDTLMGAEKEKCNTNAGKVYRESKFNCNNMAQPADKAQCQKYNEEWKTARATQPQGSATAVRSGEPNPIPADAGDPTDKERNRDSTKQQEASPQPEKQN
jgi:hypothetical protein